MNRDREAALSPTTQGGEIQGRLAAKDGAAAPPQAPVEVLSRLVSQLSKADWTDDHGHNLVRLQAFIEAKAFVENNNAA